MAAFNADVRKIETNCAQFCGTSHPHVVVAASQLREKFNAMLATLSAAGLCDATTSEVHVRSYVLLSLSLSLSLSLPLLSRTQLIHHTIHRTYLYPFLAHNTQRESADASGESANATVLVRLEGRVPDFLARREDIARGFVLDMLR